MSDYGDFCREMRAARQRYKWEHGPSEEAQAWIDLAEENRWRKYELKKEWKVPEYEAEKFAKKLIQRGAKLMTKGVYRLGRFDFYPRKSNARDFRTNEFFDQDDALELVKG